MSSASRCSIASGFSQKTCFPARAAASMMGRCTSWDVAILMKSTSGSRMISMKSVVTWGTWYSSASFRAPASDTSQHQVHHPRVVAGGFRQVLPAANAPHPICATHNCPYFIRPLLVSYPEALARGDIVLVLVTGLVTRSSF